MRYIDAFIISFPSAITTPVGNAGGVKDLGKRVRGHSGFVDLDLRLASSKSFEITRKCVRMACRRWSGCGARTSRRTWRRSPMTGSPRSSTNIRTFAGWSALLRERGRTPRRRSRACARERRQRHSTGNQCQRLPLDEPPVPDRSSTSLPESGKPILLHPRRREKCPTIRPRKFSKYENLQRAGLALRDRPWRWRAGFFRNHGLLSDLKVIAHHLGGVIPYLEGRVAHSFDQLGVRTFGRGLRRLLKSLKKRPTITSGFLR